MSKKQLFACYFLVSAIAMTGAIVFPRRAGRTYRPVAPWDYADPPNTHPMAHPGAVMPLPDQFVDLDGYHFQTASGINLRIVSLNKGNTQNPDHMWSPDGMPLRPTGFQPGWGPDTPPASDGPRRVVTIMAKAPKLTMASSIFYLPECARSGLTGFEKRFHGWGDISQLGLGTFATPETLDLYVDDPAATSLMVGIAEGPWKTVGSFNNPLKSPPYLNKLVAKGAWGHASVTQAEGEPPSIGFEAKSARGVPCLTVELSPPKEPIQEELALVAYDAAGNNLTRMEGHNVATVYLSQIPRIVRFEVRARPYKFYRFRNVHFDPDPDAYRNTVWGPDQPSIKAHMGPVTPTLLALSSTRLGTEPYDDQQYVTDEIYTCEGKVWKDVPQELGIQPAPFNSWNGQPAPTAKPWIATVNFDGSTDGLEARVVIGGSTSPHGGTDFHPEWNPWAPFRDPYGGLQAITNRRWYFPFSLPAKAEYAQIQTDVAYGEWNTVQDVVPPTARVSGTDRFQRDYSLELGPTITVRYIGIDRKDHLDPLGTLDLDRFQTRVVAHLLSGEAKLLHVTSYRQEGNYAGLRPTYDFALVQLIGASWANDVALKDVKSLEVQTRRIYRGWLVLKMPRTVKEVPSQPQHATYISSGRRPDRRSW